MRKHRDPNEASSLIAAATTTVRSPPEFADRRLGSDMTNRQKRKGDRAEREAVAHLVAEAPDLVDVPNPMRMLGAGRKDDAGDLSVFSDVAVQVRNLAPASLGLAVRSSASDAVRQAANAGLPLALGLVPVHRARHGSVRWLACAHVWPATPCRDPLPFTTVAKAVEWVRADEAPYGFLPHPRRHRVAALQAAPVTPGTPVLVGTLEAWLDALRRHRQDRVSSQCA